MSEGEGLQPIARWRIIASLVLIAQVVILLALKSALEEESWFVGSVSATVDEGPLQLEGVSVNLSIDMQEEQDDLSVEYFGFARLSFWQNERDDRAALSEQKVEEYDENLDDTFDSPSPDSVKSTTFLLINVSIGLSLLLLVLICIDLRKQSSEIKRTIFRRFLSVGSFTSLLTVLILVLIVLPASWFATLADNPQDFTDGNQNEAFLAHADFSTTSSISLDGFSLEFEASGYDIGMIRPANRSAVEAEPPAPSTPDAESFISINGEMKTDTPPYVSEMVYFWLALWVFMPIALMIQQRVAIDPRLSSMKLHG